MDIDKLKILVKQTRPNHYDQIFDNNNKANGVINRLVYKYSRMYIFTFTTKSKHYNHFMNKAQTDYNIVYSDENDNFPVLKYNIN